MSVVLAHLLNLFFSFITESVAHSSHYCVSGRLECTVVADMTTGWSADGRRDRRLQSTFNWPLIGHLCGPEKVACRFIVEFSYQYYWWRYRIIGHWRAAAAGKTETLQPRKSAQHRFRWGEETGSRGCRRQHRLFHLSRCRSAARGQIQLLRVFTAA